MVERMGTDDTILHPEPLSSGKSARRRPVSWPSSKGFLPRTVIHDGVRYRVRIYRRGHGHVALAKVYGMLLGAAPAEAPEKALGCFIKLIDPGIETVRDRSGLRLA